jgi:hypothetical protein
MPADSLFPTMATRGAPYIRGTPDAGTDFRRRFRAINGLGPPLKYVQVSGVSRMPDGEPVGILDIGDTY